MRYSRCAGHHSERALQKVAHLLLTLVLWVDTVIPFVRLETEGPGGYVTHLRCHGQNARRDFTPDTLEHRAVPLPVSPRRRGGV